MLVMSWWWTYSMFPAYWVTAQAPDVRSVRLNSTRNSRRSEIISHFRPSAVQYGSVSGRVQSRFAENPICRSPIRRNANSNPNPKP